MKLRFCKFCGETVTVKYDKDKMRLQLYKLNPKKGTDYHHHCQGYDGMPSRKEQARRDVGDRPDAGSILRPKAV